MSCSSGAAGAMRAGARGALEVGLGRRLLVRARGAEARRSPARCYAVSVAAGGPMANGRTCTARPTGPPSAVGVVVAVRGASGSAKSSAGAGIDAIDDAPQQVPGQVQT